MKALTLWPEWAYAIRRLGKDGENRTWPLWESMIGKPIAIHAGALKVNAQAGSDRWRDLQAFYAATVRLGCPTPPSRADAIRSHIIAVVTCVTPTQHSGSKWAANDGQWFWPFTSIRILPDPVPCKGAQGLWDVPAEVERLIVGQP